jgi:hypothetical protein
LLLWPVRVERETRGTSAAFKTEFWIARYVGTATIRQTTPKVGRAFLSGLTDTDLGVVKQRIEARANPEIAEARAATPS